MYSYLKQKCHFFPTKMENWRAEQVLSGFGISGSGEDGGKGEGG
jgi:hypothetical protein